MNAIFETVQQLFEDYTLTDQGFQEAEHSAKEVVAAVKARLLEAQQANAQRIAQLEARAKDPSASETVRKVASLELARIRDGVPAEILESERELFNSYLHDAEQANDDLRKIRSKMQEALTRANSELSQIRQATVGDQHAELRERLIESTRKSLDALEA